MSDDFNQFLDAILQEAARRQTGAKVEPVSMKDLVTAVKPNAAPTWRSMAEDQIRELNYGTLRRDSDLPNLLYFKINGAGLARAHEVKSLRNPMKRINWNAINASAAVIAAIAAVIAAYFAYLSAVKH